MCWQYRYTYILHEGSDQMGELKIDNETSCKYLNTFNIGYRIIHNFRYSVSGFTTATNRTLNQRSIGPWSYLSSITAAILEWCHLIELWLKKKSMIQYHQLYNYFSIVHRRGRQKSLSHFRLWLLYTHSVEYYHTRQPWVSKEW